MENINNHLSYDICALDHIIRPELKADSLENMGTSLSHKPTEIRGLSHGSSTFFFFYYFHKIIPIA
jgi:hypothetical protein